MTEEPLLEVALFVQKLKDPQIAAKVHLQYKLNSIVQQITRNHLHYPEGTRKRIKAKKFNMNKSLLRHKSNCQQFLKQPRQISSQSDNFN